MIICSDLSIQLYLFYCFLWTPYNTTRILILRLFECSLCRPLLRSHSSAFKLLNEGCEFVFCLGFDWFPIQSDYGFTALFLSPRSAWHTCITELLLFSNYLVAVNLIVLNVILESLHFWGEGVWLNAFVKVRLLDRFWSYRVRSQFHVTSTFFSSFLVAQSVTKRRTVSFWRLNWAHLVIPRFNLVDRCFTLIIQQLELR